MADRLRDRHRRVQRRVRILEDDLHPPAHEPAARARDSPVISWPSKSTLPPVARTSPSSVRPERRLAAARLADEPEHLALAQVERDVVDRAHDAAPRPADEPVERSCRGSSSTSSGPRTETSERPRRFVLMPPPRLAISLGAPSAPVPPSRDLRLRPVQPAQDAPAGARASVSIGSRTGADTHRVGAARDGSGSRSAGRSGSAARPGSSAAPSCRARSSSAAARACTDAPARRRRRAPAPPPTIWPAYITATRSQASATIPRLCVISSSAVSKFSLQVGEDARGSAPRRSRRATSSARPRRAASAAARARARS